MSIARVNPKAAVRLTIANKFFAVLAVLAPLIVAVAVAGVSGLGAMKSEFDGVFAGNIHASQVSTNLGASLARADETALQLASATDPGERQRLFGVLDQSIVPAVDSGLHALQTVQANDPASDAPSSTGLPTVGHSSSRCGTPAR